MLVVPLCSHTFVLLKNRKRMKRLCILLTALLLPLFAFGMIAEDEKAIMKIPLSLEPGKILSRDVSPESIICHYYGMMDAVVTTFCSDLGEVNLTVTNVTTGEVWSEILDSAQYPQPSLAVSGSEGFYEITYITESGNIYEGTFTIR